MALKPWYAVIPLREDLRSGKPLDAAEFAVHLDKVRDGKAAEVYNDPEQFFARTYLTETLLSLAGEVTRRLSGEVTETSAVFNLSTQFGGGKTHALTLLYHLAKHGQDAEQWRGREDVRTRGCESIASSPRRLLATSPPRLIATSPPRHLATSPPRHLASSPPRLLATSPPRLLATSPPRLLASSPPRHLASSPHCKAETWHLKPCPSDDLVRQGVSCGRAGTHYDQS